LVFEKNAIFCRTLGKIAENRDHNIDPWVGNYFSTRSRFFPQKMEVTDVSEKVFDMKVEPADVIDSDFSPKRARLDETMIKIEPDDEDIQVNRLLQHWLFSYVGQVRKRSRSKSAVQSKTRPANLTIFGKKNGSEI
jgi:hypothetical protein